MKLFGHVLNRKRIQYFSALSIIFIAFVIILIKQKGFVEDIRYENNSKLDSNAKIKSIKATEEANNKIRSKRGDRQLQQDKKAKFNDLTPTEQSNNIIKRLSHLREDLTGSPDPESVVSSLWKDIKSMDSFRRRGYLGSVENQLAELDSESKNKLDWLATIFPAIEEELDRNVVFDQSAKKYLFSLISNNLERQKTDPVAEIMKLPEGKSKSAFLTGVLPQYILLKEADYRSFENQIPPELRSEFHQNIMEASANSVSFRKQGLNFYLNGQGLEGDYPNLVHGWLGDRKWVNENLDQIWELANKAQPGARRDLVTKTVMKSLEDELESERWTSLLSEKNR